MSTVTYRLEGIINAAVVGERPHKERRQILKQVPPLAVVFRLSEKNKKKTFFGSGSLSTTPEKLRQPRLFEHGPALGCEARARK